MWAKPDAMAAMLHEKSGHPLTGANTAWVPSPTAACLHSLHYFQVSSKECFEKRKRGPWCVSGSAPGGLFRVPVACSASAEVETKLLALGGIEEVTSEVREAAQAILGYVSRWVQLGVGCSKVPDLRNVELMEDRATLRINAQLLANWKLHGVVTENELRATLVEMAEVVDAQNAKDKQYESMIVNGQVRGDGGKGQIAFETAVSLIWTGEEAPNGYTEEVLHQGRRRVKSVVAGSPAVM
uniref:Malate synthase C-terminal domain-containing protein n=1 Tax=Pinguiococcus pyrenoidosus TaxID=172671 RepID=A0A7R9YB33_9STRA